MSLSDLNEGFEEIFLGGLEKNFSENGVKFIDNGVFKDRLDSDNKLKFVVFLEENLEKF